MKFDTEDLSLVFIISHQEKLDHRLSIGIYRDDCLAVTNASRKQSEDLKKKMCKVFSEFGLQTTAEANLVKVDFLDVTFALDDGSFKPYNKPNNIPQYVHRAANTGASSVEIPFKAFDKLETGWNVGETGLKVIGDLCAILGQPQSAPDVVVMHFRKMRYTYTATV